MNNPIENWCQESLAKNLTSGARLDPERSPNPFQIYKIAKKYPNRIKKAPDAVSERKMDPVGAGRMRPSALELLWGALGAHVSTKNPKNDIQNTIQNGYGEKKMLPNDMK